MASGEALRIMQPSSRKIVQCCIVATSKGKAVKKALARVGESV